MGLLKIAASVTLVCIAYQDFKARQVYWFFFPLLGIFLGLMHFFNTAVSQIFVYQILINLIMVSLVLTVLYIMVKYVLKKRFLNHSLGLGDILFFYAFALGFPSLTFIILFANSLLFSVLFFFFLKKRLELKTIPLAGIMSLFMLTVFIASVFIKQPSLYSY